MIKFSPIQTLQTWFSRKEKTTLHYDNIFGLWFGYQPKNLQLFEQALTHRSGKRRGNEQLEYLGDAVISLVVADALYHLYPTATEGTLTRLRAKVVCRENLNKIAHKMGIEQYLITPQPVKENAADIYGNAFEALVGALWLDRGYTQAEAFLKRWLIGKENRQLILLAAEEKDYKSRLLEWGQMHRQTIEFVLLNEQYDKSTDRHVFVYIVKIGDKQYAQGAGHNKLEAQQTAARNTYKMLTK